MKVKNSKRLLSFRPPKYNWLGPCMEWKSPHPKSHLVTHHYPPPFPAKPIYGGPHDCCKTTCLSPLRARFSRGTPLSLHVSNVDQPQNDVLGTGSRFAPTPVTKDIN